MKRRALIVLTLVSLASAAAPEDDRDTIQGTWVCTWVKMGHFAGAAKGEGNVSIGIRFEGDQFAEYNGKTSPAWESFTLDPTKRPKQMDLVYQDVIPAKIGGPLGKTTIRCIYELDGERLRICMGTKARPSAFVSRGEVPDTVLVYKRVKPTR